MITDNERSALKQYAALALQRDRLQRELGEVEDAMSKIVRKNYLGSTGTFRHTWPLSVILSDGRIMTFDGTTFALSRGSSLLKYQISDSV